MSIAVISCSEDLARRAAEILSAKVLPVCEFPVGFFDSFDVLVCIAPSDRTCEFSSLFVAQDMNLCTKISQLHGDTKKLLRFYEADLLNQDAMRKVVADTVAATGDRIGNICRKLAEFIRECRYSKLMAHVDYICRLARVCRAPSRAKIEEAVRGPLAATPPILSILLRYYIFHRFGISILDCLQDAPLLCRYIARVAAGDTSVVHDLLTTDWRHYEEEIPVEIAAKMRLPKNISVFTIVQDIYITLGLPRPLLICKEVLIMALGSPSMRKYCALYIENPSKILTAIDNREREMCEILADCGINTRLLSRRLAAKIRGDNKNTLLEILTGLI